jgi:capsular polysaccharide biosynthesis protein
MTATGDKNHVNGTNLGPGSPRTPPKPAPWKPPVAWSIPDVAPEGPDPSRPLAALVTLHYLRASVARRWLRCLLVTLAGLLLGVGFLVATPAKPAATTTLLLTHDANVEAQGALATDVSLLTTRVIAERTIADLGLSVTPAQLLDALTPVATGSSDVMQLTMTAPTHAEAVRRLDAFSRVYLDFRAGEVTARSKILIAGYEKRASELQVQLLDVEKKIATARLDSDAMTGLLTERSRLRDQISGVEATRHEAQLQQNAVVNASRVIDPAVPAPSNGLRRDVLVLMTALIGGAAVGVSIVVFQAVLSDRLWLRVEVASALLAPVLLSVRRLAPPSRATRVLRFLPAAAKVGASRRVARRRLAHVITRSLQQCGSSRSLAVICLDNSDEVRFGLVTAAAMLRDSANTVTIVDLTTSGDVAAAVARLLGPAADERPEVFRPEVVPSLSQGPSDLQAAGWDDVARARVQNRTTLVITDLDPAVEVDYLTSWSDDVLIAVTAGRSSAELVRTAGDLVRSARLRLRGAVLLNATRDDASLGRPAPDPAVADKPEVDTPAAAAPGAQPQDQSGAGSALTRVP